ncbi:hypothetical protein JST56_07120 [Candidatus Dependentiae bacterium]|nr:hypothetical protein [Candidatus Dependentiae bacterium]
MSTTVEIDKDALLKAHKSGTAAEKKLLEKLHGKDMFQPDLMQTVKSIADIYRLAGVNARSYALPKTATADQIAENAFRKLRLAAQIMNQGWKPDWSNDNQYKYYPYFVWDNKKKGFSFAHVGCLYTLTSVGSRLCFRTSALAEFFGKTFLSEYNDFLIN